MSYGDYNNGYDNGGYNQGGYGPVTNRLAVASWIVAIIFPILGLIFGIIAYNRAKHRGGVGHGHAVAGIVVGIVLIFVYGCGGRVI